MKTGSDRNINIKFILLLKTVLKYPLWKKIMSDGKKGIEKENSSSNLENTLNWNRSYDAVLAHDLKEDSSGLNRIMK